MCLLTSLPGEINNLCLSSIVSIVYRYYHFFSMIHAPIKPKISVEPFLIHGGQFSFMVNIVRLWVRVVNFKDLIVHVTN